MDINNLLKFYKYLEEEYNLDYIDRCNEEFFILQSSDEKYTIIYKYIIEKLYAIFKMGCYSEEDMRRLFVKYNISLNSPIYNTIMRKIK